MKQKYNKNWITIQIFIYIIVMIFVIIYFKKRKEHFINMETDIPLKIKKVLECNKNCTEQCKNEKYC